MNENPLVSVIIVNYNGRTLLEKCLQSLMKNTYQNFEVILVDNNSEDDSIEFVKNTYPSVIIIKLEKNYGFAYPNNVGVKNTKGDFLLFLNNDTEVTPNFLNELVKTAQKDSEIVILQSLLLRKNGDVDSCGDFIDNLGRAFHSKKIPEGVEPILSARGASMMVRKEKFVALGGFDEEFYFSYEDVDLGWRAWIWGYKVVLVPTSVVYHHSGKTVQQLRSELIFHGVKNSIIICFVNFEFHIFLKSLLVMNFKIFTQKIFGISTTQESEDSIAFPSYKILLKGLFWVIRHYKYVLNKRKLVNLKRKRSTKDLRNLKLIHD